MRRGTWSVLLAWCFVSVGACSPRSRGGGDDDDDSGDGDADADVDGDSDADADADGSGCTKVDILFVVDDSGSMAEEQSNLASNFPTFIERLEAYRTANDTQLDYRVGVTSTSRDGLALSGSLTVKMGGSTCNAGDACGGGGNECECPGLGFDACAAECPDACYCEPAGSTLPVPSEHCGGEDGALVPPSGYPNPWIDGPGGEVADAFTQAASLGTGGCSLEMPLYAVEHALSPSLQSAPGGPNEGFLRPDALLMLILITDEDDCSAEIDEFSADTVIDLNHPLASASSTDNGCTDGTGNENDAADWISLQHTLDFLDGLVGARSHWAAAVIAGETSCSSSFGDAYTAHRLLHFVQMAGDNAVFGDICAGDLSGALDDALDALQVACDDYELF